MEFNTVKDLCEFATTLATIGTMYAAYRALVTWQDQIVANRKLELHKQIIDTISEWEISTFSIIVENTPFLHNKNTLNDALHRTTEREKQIEKSQISIDLTSTKIRALSTTIKYSLADTKEKEALLIELNTAISIQRDLRRKISTGSISHESTEFPLNVITPQIEKIAEASQFLNPLQNIDYKQYCKI
jgi:hypothetical protein